MTEKIRIMHVTGSLNIGGVEELLLLTAKANQADKYDLAFTSCHSHDGYSSRQIQELGYKVFGLGTSQRMYDLRIIPKLISVFRRYRPHIVHCYYKISLPGRLAAKLAGVPVIICNEVDMDWEKYGVGLAVMARIKRKMNFLADKVVACSEAVRKYWDPSNSNKYSVMYLPIELSTSGKEKQPINNESRLEEKYPVIGMVSRVVSGKGHEYLIKAMPKILIAFPEARLKIVGNGPILDAMKELARSLNLENSIEFTGFVEDLHAELSSFDIFVLPSLTEGFPLSVLEAMAAGLPVAATPVGGTPEVVESGKTGLLFAPKEPDALADAVITIMADRDQAIEMGKLGRKKIESEFTPEIYSRNLDMLYQEMLTAKGIS